MALRNPASSSSESLRLLSGLVAGVDVSGFAEPDLRALLARVRTAQRCLDGLVVRIGVRSDHLAADGRAGSAEETIRGGGAVGSRQARREAARTVAVELVDGLGDALSQGETTGEHVDSIARRTAGLTDEQRTAMDMPDLVEQSKHLPAETFDRLLKRRVDLVTANHGLADTTARQEASEFRHWFNHDTGMGHLSATLDPERYEAAVNAIEHHMTAIAAASDQPETKTRNLAARALVELVTGGGDRELRSRLPYVTVIVDHDTIIHGPHAGSIRQTENGRDLSAASVARLCCDAVIRRVSLDERGVPLNVGRKYRTATDAQWSAIKAVHGSCAWSGCDAPITWCQAHHINEWEHGGQTDLDNLVPLCNRHHHLVHEGRWRIEFLPDRSLEIHRPDGTHHATVRTPQRC